MIALVGFRRFIRRALVALLIVSLVMGVSSGVMVIMRGLSLDRAPADAIVVMGAAQFDGDPSPVLRNRLDHALALYRKDIAPRIITVGSKQVGDRFTEADAGRRYLRSKGVPSKDLVVLPSGVDTYSSAVAVATWCLTHKIRYVMVVSDRAHLARASTMIKSFGIAVEVSGPATGPGSSMGIDRLLHEMAGLIRFWLIGGRNPSDIVSGLWDRPATA